MMRLILCFLLLLFASCGGDRSTEKHQSKRKNIVDVRDRVREIEMPDVYIGPISEVRLMDSLLLITDTQTSEYLLHIFNKNSFRHIADRIRKGRGPSEMVTIGFLIIGDDGHFYVMNYNSGTLYKYDMQELLGNIDYVPAPQKKFGEKQVPLNSRFINDSILLGEIAEPVGNASFKTRIATWNINNDDVTFMPYEHPSIERKRSTIDLSVRHGIYVEAYHHHDLFTICQLDGTLKYNVYGPNWDDETSNKMLYYLAPHICKDKIVIAYSGRDNFDDEVRNPTCFHIFDLEGNYLQTLDVGYKIVDFTYDEENNRLILDLNDVIQFATLDLDGIV